MEEKPKENDNENKIVDNDNNTDKEQKNEQIENKNDEIKEDENKEKEEIKEDNEKEIKNEPSENKNEEKDKKIELTDTNNDENSNTYVESTEPFMQVASKELIPCLNDKDNRQCFDCNSSPANWICVNNSIFLCSKCAGEHRGYGAIISNLKFIMLDKLNEFQIEIMKIGGNKKLNHLLEEYKIDKNKIDKLIMYSSRLLEYHRDYLYNQLAGKDEPKPPNKFDATKIMTNFKDNPRPPLEKIKVKDERFTENENENKDNKKGNCKVQ